MIERYKHNQMNTSIPLSACFRSFHLKIRVISSKKKRNSARKKKTKMEKRNLASKESGADFLAHNLTLKTPLVYAFARLKESSGVADFLYPMDYSLTFICFDWWCKMWGFAPNPLSRPEMEHRCQKWTHRANQKWSSSRTRNGRIACTQKWFKTNIPFYHFKTICRKDDCYTRHKIV
jgi:hypothetical protein